MNAALISSGVEASVIFENTSLLTAFCASQNKDELFTLLICDFKVRSFASSASIAAFLIHSATATACICIPPDTELSISPRYVFVSSGDSNLDTGILTPYIWKISSANFSLPIHVSIPFFT